MTKLSLTPKLTLVFVGFAAAVLIGVDLIGYFNTQAALKAATINELETIAGEKEAAVTAWINDRQADVTALSAAPSTVMAVSVLVESSPDSPEWEILHDQLLGEFRTRILSGEFLDLFLLDPQTGKVILGVQPGREGLLKANRAYFMEGRKGPYTTPIYISPELQSPTMLAAVPVVAEDGELLAVLTGRLNLDDPSLIVQRRSGLQETDDAFLVNASRLVVTQPRFLQDPAVLRQGINTVPVNLCVQHNSGTVFANDYQNIPVIAAYRWMPANQMCLIVKISQAEALAPINAFRGRTIWVALAVLGVATVVSYALSLTIVRPVLAMRIAAQRYGRGDLDVRLPETRQDELGYWHMSSIKWRPYWRKRNGTWRNTPVRFHKRCRSAPGPCRNPTTSCKVQRRPDRGEAGCGMSLKTDLSFLRDSTGCWGFLW